MPLSNYPQILKYAVGDRPYTLTVADFNPALNTGIDGFLNGRSRGYFLRVQVTGWRTVVTELGGSGIQKNYYTVRNITGYNPNNVSFVSNAPGFVELYGNEYEISEEKLFSSRNHLMYSIKGDYINSSYNGDTNGGKLFQSWGLHDDHIVQGPGFGVWVDLAGMDFRNAKLDLVEGVVIACFSFKWREVGNYYIGGEYGGVLDGTPALIFDGVNLTGADLGTDLDTKTEFRTAVYSYDEKTTIWTDGNPIGRA